MNKIKLSKFSNEFDVPQHLDLSNGSLFLLLGEEGIFTLIIDWKKYERIKSVFRIKLKILSTT